LLFLRRYRWHLCPDSGVYCMRAPAFLRSSRS